MPSFAPPDQDQPVPIAIPGSDTASRTVAIMQPYFLPYLGYFSLIKQADRFVLFDQVQFIRHGWIERNRILKPVEGVQYIAVPLEKFSRETHIIDLRVRPEPWKEKMFRQLEHYKKRAPHYQTTMDLLDRILDGEERDLVEVIRKSLVGICDHLGISTPIERLSAMHVELPEHAAPGEWALHITRGLGYTCYINPAGAMAIFDREAYRREGVELVFLRNQLTPYSQRRPVFEPGLSIVDVLMFNDREAAGTLLDAVEYI